MAAPWRAVSVPRLVFLALALAVGVTLIFGGLTSAATFGTHNTGWDGTSRFHGLATEPPGETAAVTDVADYGTVNASASVSFVIAPDASYSPSDADRVSEFVRDGGTLVVAGDVTNTSNRLLAAVGADARFDGDRLRDERNFETSPDVPLATNPREHAYTEGVDALALNYGTVVEPHGATPVVNSSSFAYVDDNGDGDLDATETVREYPVVTVERVGDGEVVAVSDPSVFINEMLDRADNRQFARNLVSPHRVRLFDVSHGESLPPLVSAQIVLRESVLLQVGVGFAAVVLLSYVRIVSRVSGWLRDRGPRGRTRPLAVDESAVESWVADRYPDWDWETTRRVSEEIMRVKQNRGEDD